LFKNSSFYFLETSLIKYGRSYGFDFEGSMHAPEFTKFLYIVDACFETEDLFD
jgi:hypothetical protein